MISNEDTQKVKETVEQLLNKMTMSGFSVQAVLSSDLDGKELSFKGKEQENNSFKEVVNLDIKLEEPQILIGQNGQTLYELERILRIVLAKKLQKSFYLKLDINGYKKKKIEYLKNLAKDLADQVSQTKQKKVLSPMPSFDRRIIHSELSGRTDIITESQGQGIERHIIISPVQ